MVSRDADKLFLRPVAGNRVRSHEGHAPARVGKRAEDRPLKSLNSLLIAI